MVKENNEMKESLVNEMVQNKIIKIKQEFQLAKKVHENTINNMNISGQIIDEQRCDSKWSAKHSDLAFFYKKMEITHFQYKCEIDVALKRQRY
ncbi:Hypothetical protein CINCED_3A003629 [Cinara cedri]|uniref:Uncharacterized protein n=1 Tax=Cinara cedri TaxID=506608 RepID=A0A5E4M9L8_9HEMI|nr:Hypothetical protein CINCED_3A003629 [Cinara cedri]